MSEAILAALRARVRKASCDEDFDAACSDLATALSRLGKDTRAGAEVALTSRAQAESLMWSLKSRSMLLPYNILLACTFYGADGEEIELPLEPPEWMADEFNRCENCSRVDAKITNQLYLGPNFRCEDACVGVIRQVLDPVVEHHDDEDLPGLILLRRAPSPSEDIE